MRQSSVETAADAAANASSGSAGPASRSARMLCSCSRLNSSPVITVRKRAIRPSSSRAHLLCVPGWQTRQSAGSGRRRRAPSNWTSSPRITSASSGSTKETPGTIAVRPASGQTRFAARSSSAGGAGDIGRFDPAAVGADHAGEQQRLVAEPLADFGDGVAEAALGRPTGCPCRPRTRRRSRRRRRSDRRGGWSFPNRRR